MKPPPDITALERMTVFSGRFSAMMSRATERCTQVGESERLLGYTTIADTYKELVDEFSGLAIWVWQEETQKEAAEAEVDP